ASCRLQEKELLDTIKVPKWGVDKKKPTYDLATLKAAFSNPNELRMTLTARQGAFALGLTSEDIVAIIQSLERAHFDKSMTTYASAQLWQDVYKAPWAGTRLYIKFSLNAAGKELLVSFKEA